MHITTDDIWRVFPFLQVGGFLGLLLGASVITVCEVFDFIIVSIVTSIEAKKDVKRKREEKEQELNSKA